VIETLYVGADEIRLSAGKFRTSRRYIRGVPSGLFAIVKGRSIAVTAVVVGSSILPRYRYSVDGVVIEPAGSQSFDAAVQDVTL
jgi:hypothetical protein